MNIKIYGTLIGNSNVFFVTSGVGSLAASNRDVVHIGASATGAYAVPLGNAQLSDASNVFYDGYLVHISATGAARQTLILSGVRASLSDILSTMGSQFAVVSNYLSNASNYLSNLSALLSDVDSALTSQFTYSSNVLSYLSNMDSNLSGIASDILSAARGNSDALSDLLSRVNSASFLSDIASHVWAAKYTANSAASSFGSLVSDVYSRLALTQTNAAAAASRALLVQSSISDVQSYLVAMSDVLSDFYSDFQSRVPKAVATNSQLSDLHSDLRSYLVVISGIQSDLYSALSDLQSDFQSRVPKRVATDSQLSDLHSDLRSFLVVMSGIQSDIYSGIVALSDAVSNAYSAAVQANSRALVIQSLTSDIDSALTSQFVNQASLFSDIYSGVQLLQSAFIGHTGSTASQVTDASVVEIAGVDHDDQFNGYFLKLLGGSQVDELRLIVDTVQSTGKLTVKPAFNSRLASGVDFVIVAGSPWQSRMHSDLRSYLVALSGLVSDIDSALTSQFTHLSDAVSNAYSAAAQGNSRVLVTQSMASDATSALAIANSRILLNQSRISDVASFLVAMSDVLSDFYSDFQSRVPKLVATNSQLSDLTSDLLSYLTGLSGALSDTYSQLSDFRSDLASLVTTTGVQLNASTMSDLRSAITAAGGGAGATASQIWTYTGNERALTAEGNSDVASAVWAHAVGTRVDSRVLLNLSQISDVLSQVSDFRSDVVSLITTTGVQLNASSLSDIRSAIAAGPAATVTASDISDIASAVWAHTIGTRVDSRILVIQSTVSDTLSGVVALSGLVSDVDSALTSRFSDLLSLVTTTGVQLNASSLSDIRSAIAAGPAATVTASDISDIASAVWAHTVGTRVDSRVLLNLSRLSDVYSLLSDAHSDLRSQIGGITVSFGASEISDIASAVRAALVSDLSDIYSAAQQTNSRALVNQSRVSDIYSLLSDFQSDFGSRVPKLVATNSQLSDLASDLKSQMLALSGMLSDVDSAVTSQYAATSQYLSQLNSDLLSHLDTTGVALNASTLSDLRSAVLSLSGMLSDAHSAAAQANSRAAVIQSQTSDIYSLLSDVSSDMGVLSGVQSDLYSLLSDFHSDFGSRVPGRVLVRADQIAELPPGWTPADTPTLEQIEMLVYAGLKNRFEQTSAFREWYRSDGSMIVRKAVQIGSGSLVESAMEPGI